MADDVLKDDAIFVGKSGKPEYWRCGSATATAW